MVQSTAPDQAKAYFADSLSQADYFINDQELAGRFAGKLAARIGLNEKVSKEAFFAMCENKNPITGKNLTPYTKENRRVGYDINFHCPKSLSVIHALSKDDHILEAFEASVAETMHDIEADVQGRVRKDGIYQDRQTGELAWASFTHLTARPVDGPPDPHLHAHCFVFNATWDDVEKQFKAGQFGQIKTDMPYYQSRFHKRLSDKLIDLGYGIRRTEKAFEIEGCPQKVIDLFSKRTDHIGRIAKEKGITDPEKLSELGARTRAKKQKGLSMAELKEAWRSQIAELGKDETEGEQPIRYAPDRTALKTSPDRCVNFAVDHAFERASVMAERRILETAYRQSLGDVSVTLDAVTENFNADGRIIRIQDRGRNVATTCEVLAEEKHMVDLARKGQGKLLPLYRDVPELTSEGQQAAAITHMLTTTDRLTLVRGAAGAGKTTMLKEAVALMEKAGKHVTMVAPSASASRDNLRKEGFLNAETVDKLLLSPDMQAQLKGQVLICDEAGLLGTKKATALLALAEKHDCRVIYVGDTRQHNSTERGDALRILNTVGSIKTAEISKIYRQRNIHYRAAVEDLSKGDVKTAFEKLDGIEFIKTVDPMNPHARLTDDYVAALKKGKTALVVSPTHKQGDEVTEAIREKLRKAGMIGKKEIKAARLVNLNLTEAEKSDWRNFREGQLVQFNQHVKGAKRGSTWAVVSAEENKVTVRNSQGQSLTMPHDKAKAFDLFNKTEIGLSKGDKVRVTHLKFDEQNRRMDNGLLLDVVSVSKNGGIVLRNPVGKSTYLLDKEFGHLAHAHVVTSHYSQGKTVQEIFISQPAATFPATDAKQFYVSVSRGRDAAHIYTDDKEALLDHASRLGDRQSALELVGGHDKHLEHVLQHQRQRDVKTAVTKKPKETISINYTIDRDYEPGL
ncbi:hypothetical protein GCM10022209_02660 [Chitinophaga oryziterrae]